MLVCLANSSKRMGHFSHNLNFCFFFPARRSIRAISIIRHRRDCAGYRHKSSPKGLPVAAKHFPIANHFFFNQ